MQRTNFAPTSRTLIVALVLVIIGVFGPFGTLVPDAVGIGALMAATLLLLLGMVIKGI